MYSSFDRAANTNKTPINPKDEKIWITEFWPSGATSINTQNSIPDTIKGANIEVK